MAHFAVGFLALGLLAVVLAGPPWVALLLVIPIMLSVAGGQVPDSRRQQDRDRAFTSEQRDRRLG